MGRCDREELERYDLRESVSSVSCDIDSEKNRIREYIYLQRESRDMRGERNDEEIEKYDPREMVLSVV